MCVGTQRWGEGGGWWISLWPLSFLISLSPFTKQNGVRLPRWSYSSTWEQIGFQKIVPSSNFVLFQSKQTWNTLPESLYTTLQPNTTIFDCLAVFAVIETKPTRSQMITMLLLIVVSVIRLLQTVMQTWHKAPLLSSRPRHWTKLRKQSETVHRLQQSQHSLSNHY